jgi:hypothetical protein
MILMGIFIAAACIMIIVASLRNNNKHEPIKTEYPIDYPEEPMFENFASITEALYDCDCANSLKTVYVRIIIFQSVYNDSKVFTDELWDLYRQKEFFIV